MRSYRHSGKSVKRLNLVVVVVACIAILFFIVLHVQLKTHIDAICEYKGKQEATETISREVNTILQTQEEDFSSLITISKDSAGNITSIESNPMQINQLKGKIAAQINESLANLENEEITIALGTLTGANLLTGRGPDVTLKIHQLGAVDVDINSSFSSAGINQTLHRMTLTVHAELSAVVPSHTTHIELETDYILAETVIVGEVPLAVLSAIEQ